MSWISRLLGLSRPTTRGADGEFARLVTDRKTLLIRHFRIQIGKARSNSQLVPQAFVRACERVFAEHLNDISEKVVRSELQVLPTNHGYPHAKSGIYMVVSIMPWTTEEAVRKLAEMSDDRPFGYVSMMTNIFNNWPSPDLTHYLHVLLCLGGGVFQMHTAMGDYGGFPKAVREFTVFPTDLLNAEERRKIGL